MGTKLYGVQTHMRVTAIFNFAFYYCKAQLVDVFHYLTSVCPCIASKIVNDDQKDANILAYLFIYS